MSLIDIDTIIPEQYAGQRLDQALARMFTDHSRERIKAWILNGDCLIDGEKLQPKSKVNGGERVVIKANLPVITNWQPEEEIAAQFLNIIYEDDEILVLNKPANCVVHPGSGNYEHTLVNALLHHCPKLENIPRAGIVHRLDKNTTGLMVVAKTMKAHYSLIEQLQQRTVSRIYEAVINGVMISGGTISQAIGRSPKDRLKMAVVATGKPAITHYRILEKFRNHTKIQVKLETGRTHQIRVHMEYVRHPILGDTTYGAKVMLPRGADDKLITTIRTFPRQALHAKALSLKHPGTSEIMSWQVPLPDDFQQLLDELRKDARAFL